MGKNLQIRFNNSGRYCSSGEMVPVAGILLTLANPVTRVRGAVKEQLNVYFSQLPLRGGQAGILG